MTRDSVEAASVCKREWTRALSYKKPIIPIKLHADAEMPFRLDPRQHIDFTRALDSETEFNAALARLRRHVARLESPEGALQALKDRLADAQRDLRREKDPTQQTRIQDETDQLKKDIARQEEVVRDPKGVARRTEESIARGLERERKPERPVAGVQRSKFIYPPPDDKKAREWEFILANLILLLALLSPVLFGGRPKSITIDLVKIPKGDFRMKSINEKKLPGHKVTFSMPFYMGRQEVTQAEWKMLMGDNPSGAKGDNLPVENISWKAAHVFINKLNLLNDGYHYSLPTEAEWEYACKAGDDGKDCADVLATTAWYGGTNDAKQTHTSMEKSPNALGLYDMHGNVWE
jgi:formylglycine-generating enzyme required for sulfatase activity